MLKVVDRRVASFVIFFTLVGTSVAGANIIGQFAPLSLLGQQHTGLARIEYENLISLPVAVAALGYSVQQVLYAGYLLAAAYVVFRSTFFPRIVGVLLAIGTLSYLVYSFASFLAPDFAARLVPYVQLPSLVGEGSFCVCLLAIGVNLERWKRQAASS